MIERTINGWKTGRQTTAQGFPLSSVTLRLPVL